MAISSSNFVKVSSEIMNDAAVPRDFSGLVISKGTPLSGSLGTSYDSGEIVTVNINSLASLFGSSSPEFSWASNYFAYVSKSGTIPAKLKFMKLKTVSTAAATADATVTKVTGSTLAVTDVDADDFEDALSSDATAAASVNAGSSITAVTVTAATFSSKVGGVSGTYAFTCTTGGASGAAAWTLAGSAATLSQYGIAFTGTAAVNDVITVVFTASVAAVDGTYEFTYATGSVWKMNGETVDLDDYGITKSGTAAVGDKISVAFTASTVAGTETPVNALIRAIGQGETFGSFTFLSGEATGVATASLLKAAAQYNASLKNAYRMVVDYSLTSTDTNYYGNYVTKVNGVIGGELWNIAGLTLCCNCSFLTMARLAATDYTGSNTASCDMFKSVSGVSATVTTDEMYETLSERRLNFVGLVKEHGNQWNWYMRGYNMDGSDTACYDNEMWFKSEIIKDLLALDDSVEKIPANAQGLSMVSVTIQDTIKMALANGTILPGKPISTEKQQSILAVLGGDSDLLSQLLENGWVLVLTLNDDNTIEYLVAYLKGDAVRYIGGSHVIA